MCGAVVGCTLHSVRTSSQESRPSAERSSSVHPVDITPEFTSQEMECAQPPALKPFKEMRVVFVDDEAANCRLGVRMLGRIGVPDANVTVLRDGKG